MLLHDIGSQVLSVEVSTDLLVKDVIASGTLDRRHALNLALLILTCSLQACSVP